MRNVEEYTQASLEDKFPLLEIDTELTKVMPPDEVLELVNACVSLSGYSRNDIRNAFFRALSIPALDVYVDADQRCKVAIDIVVNVLQYFTNWIEKSFSFIPISKYFSLNV